MESNYAELQADNIFIDPPDVQFWNQGEPWGSHVEACSPAFSNPIDDIFPQLSSCDGSVSGMDDCEQLYYSNGTMPHFETLHPAEEPHLVSLNQVQTQPKDKANSKRKRTQPSAARPTKLKLKLAHRSRSASSSPCHYIKKDVKSNNKEEIYLERSRLASNKFRARKRNEIAELESEECSVGNENRQLHSILEALTSEIMSLKVQLLQHADCSCELIQAYINKEAHHFVQNLDSVAEALPR